jgi:hypothetical protein
VSTRVLVVYERPDGRYDAHEGRGEVLAAAVTARTPFGGDGRPIEPVPLARGLDHEAALSRLRPGHHELCVTVDPFYTTRTLVALPLGLVAADGPVALVGSHGPVDALSLLGWVRGFRAALLAAVDRGLEVGVARTLLHSEADGLADEGRTVHRLDG